MQADMGKEKKKKRQKVLTSCSTKIKVGTAKKKIIFFEAAVGSSCQI